MEGESTKTVIATLNLILLCRWLTRSCCTSERSIPFSTFLRILEASRAPSSWCSASWCSFTQNASNKTRFHGSYPCRLTTSRRRRDITQAPSSRSSQIEQLATSKRRLIPMTLMPLTISFRVPPRSKRYRSGKPYVASRASVVETSTWGCKRRQLRHLRAASILGNSSISR